MQNIDESLLNVDSRVKLQNLKSPAVLKDLGISNFCVVLVMCVRWQGVGSGHV